MPNLLSLYKAGFFFIFFFLVLSFTSISKINKNYLAHTLVALRELLQRRPLATNCMSGVQCLSDLMVLGFVHPVYFIVVCSC